MSVILPPPIIVTPAPDWCPQCHREEDRREVCAHCGYKYPDDKGFGFWEVFGVILVLVGIAVAFLWVLATLYEWLMGHRNLSLVEVLVEQWRWLSSRRVW